MSRGKDHFIFTGDDEGFDKYGLTAEDLSVLISPTVLSPQCEPMISPMVSNGSGAQNSTGSEANDNFFFDVNDLPSLGSQDHHFFGVSPAVTNHDTGVPNPHAYVAQSMPPPVPLHPKMPSSRDKKQKKSKRKSVFSFDLNEVNKFSNGQATPVIKNDANGNPIPVAVNNQQGGNVHHGQVHPHHQQHHVQHQQMHPQQQHQQHHHHQQQHHHHPQQVPNPHQQSASLTDSYINFNLGMTPHDAGSLPSLSSLGYASQATSNSPNVYFQDASIILNKPPSHRSRNSSANSSGYLKSFSPSELQDLREDGELREPRGLHVRGKGMQINPQPYDPPVSSSGTPSGVSSSGYVTAYRSPKSALNLLTAEDIADLEFLKIDFSDPVETPSEDYYYSSEATNSTRSAASSHFSPQSDAASPGGFGLNSSNNNVYYGMNMSSVLGSGDRSALRRNKLKIEPQVEIKGETGSGKSSSGRTKKLSPVAADSQVDKEEKTSKSLSAISRRFIEFYGGNETIDYISGLSNPEDFDDSPEQVARVDGAAETLGVHVRRIYELIKILEILSLVTFSGGKRGKFTWKGTKHFMTTLGLMQADGMVKYPEIAAMSGLKQMPQYPPSLKSLSLDDGPDTNFDFGGNSGLNSVRHSNHSLTGLDLPGSGDVPGGHVSSSNPIGLISDSDFESGDELMGHFRIDHPGVAEAAGQDSSHPHHRAGPLPPSYSAAEKHPPAAPPKPLVRGSSTGSVTGDHEDVMMESICKSFLQLFLVGLDGISMGYAIQQIVPKDDNQTLQEYNKKNATKIRRVYDVANVLCSVNLIKKQANSKLKRPDSKGDSKALMWSSFPPLLVREYFIKHHQDR